MNVPGCMWHNTIISKNGYRFRLAYWLFLLFVEVSLSQLVLDDTNDSSHLTPSSLSNSVWSYTPSSKNGDIFNTSILSSLQRASKSFIETHTETPKPSLLNFKTADHLTALSAQPKKICTVEELEKNLLQSSKQQAAASGSHVLLQSTPKQPAPVPLPRPLGPPPGVHPQGPPFHPLLQVMWDYFWMFFLKIRIILTFKEVENHQNSVQKNSTTCSLGAKAVACRSKSTEFSSVFRCILIFCIWICSCVRSE